MLARFNRTRFLFSTSSDWAFGTVCSAPRFNALEVKLVKDMVLPVDIDVTVEDVGGLDVQSQALVRFALLDRRRKCTSCVWMRTRIHTV